MINYTDDLLKIFKEDNDQLLNSPIKPTTVSKDQKLVDSFREINSFFKTNDREPQSSDDISERKLAARLSQIKADPTLIKILKPFDDHNLLGEIKDIANEPLIVTMDDLWAIDSIRSEFSNDVKHYAVSSLEASLMLLAAPGRSSQL